MPNYEVRLYAWKALGSDQYIQVDCIPFEADDDVDAITKAPKVQIPTWDDSDWALLYGENGPLEWRMDRPR